MARVFLVLSYLALVSHGRAVTVGATYDADTYYFTQTYNEVRTGALNSGTFHVGQHILNTSPTYNGHFNFGAVVFQDLTSFSSPGSKFLQLNVKDFKTPVAVDPGYQGPPQYSYLNTGNFRLAVVTLAADFTETAATADLPGWYQSNLYARPRLAEIDITSAGVFQVDVTAAVDGWISTPSTNFGFGFVGLDSTPTASTLRFYSMEAAGGVGPVLIPEPGTGTLLLLGLAGAMSMRRRFCA